LTQGSFYTIDWLRRGKPGERYNFGGAAERTNLQLIDTLCEILEEQRPAAANSALAQRGASTYKDLKTFVTDRPGHDRKYAVDWSKIKKELSWEPKHDFDTWLEETVEWYKNNESWWKDVKDGEYQKYYEKQYS